MYPDSEALYDNYFEKINDDEIYLEKQKENYLFNLIELYELSTIREPPTKILKKDVLVSCQMGAHLLVKEHRF
jgi:hypothetical protein